MVEHPLKRADAITSHPMVDHKASQLNTTGHYSINTTIRVCEHGKM